ncbi:PCS1 [Symbiodinium pilosum]|uniref:PCS1 protein n=1 Tax=Symbiodinium pilosum TaxID=2952 RepID=A0A812PMR5_SYMPI|nr:PCS1 [Symbiodinium pilosum]
MQRTDQETGRCRGFMILRSKEALKQSCLNLVWKADDGSAPDSWTMVGVMKSFSRALLSERLPETGTAAEILKRALRFISSPAMPLEVACNVFDADREALSEEKRKACWEAHKALSEIVEKLDEVLGTQCLNTCMSTQCTEDSCETLAGAVFTAANVLAIDLNMWRKADGREFDLTGPGAQGTLRLSARYVELKLDEFNLRRQLRALDGTLPHSAAFVVLVGIDCCTFPDERVEEDSKKRGSFMCKVTCEEQEQVFRNRAARKQGRYGATAWWRLESSELSSPETSSSSALAEAEEDEETCHTAHFQSTFTHMLVGDPRSTVCHIKLEKRGGLPGVGNVVGEVEFPVYRLIHAASNTTKAVLRIGSAQLSLLAQLRATENVASDTSGSYRLASETGKGKLLQSTTT